MALNQLTLILTVFATGAVTFALHKNVFILNPVVVIGELKHSRNDSIGVVKGVRSCGGSAQVLQWRYATCFKTDKVCHVPTDSGLRTSQVDFVPSNDIVKPALRLIVKSTDGKVNSTYDDGKVIVNNGVKKGISYTVTAIGGNSEELKGKDAVFQYIVYDLSNGAIQFCAETDMKFD